MGPDAKDDTEVGRWNENAEFDGEKKIYDSPTILAGNLSICASNNKEEVEVHSKEQDGILNGGESSDGQTVFQSLSGSTKPRRSTSTSKWWDGNGNGNGDKNWVSKEEKDDNAGKRESSKDLNEEANEEKRQQGPAWAWGCSGRSFWPKTNRKGERGDLESGNGQVISRSGGDDNEAAVIEEGNKNVGNRDGDEDWEEDGNEKTGGKELGKQQTEEDEDTEDENEVNMVRDIYRWSPILSGILCPFGIILEIPGLTEHWYVKTDNNHPIVYRNNPIILDVALAFSMFSAVAANICLILRFAEKKPRTNTLIAIGMLTVHDVINIATLIIFAVVHSVDDGFTYSQSYWVTLASTIVSLLVNFTLIIDAVRFFGKAGGGGSGLTRKQRSMVMCIMAWLMWLSLGAMCYALLLEISFQDSLYFTLATITTTGYGDIVVDSTGARIFAFFYDIIGIVMLAMVVNMTRETVIESFETAYRSRRDLLLKLARRRRKHHEKYREKKAKERKRKKWLRHYRRLRKNENSGGAVGGLLSMTSGAAASVAMSDKKGSHSKGMSIPFPPSGANSGDENEGRKWKEMDNPISVGEFPTAIGSIASPSQDRDTKPPNDLSHQEHYRTHYPHHHIHPGRAMAKAAHKVTGGIAKAGHAVHKKLNKTMGADEEAEKDKAEYVDFKREMEDEEKRDFSVKITLAVCMFLFFWVIGALVFKFTENWPYFVALWFCFVTFSTLGYGDFTPKSPAGRAFFFAWAIFGIAAVTILFSVLTEAWSARFKHVLEDSAFTRISRRIRRLQKSHKTVPEHGLSGMSSNLASTQGGSATAPGRHGLTSHSFHPARKIARLAKSFKNRWGEISDGIDHLAASSDSNSDEWKLIKLLKTANASGVDIGTGLEAINETTGIADDPDKWKRIVFWAQAEKHLDDLVGYAEALADALDHHHDLIKAGVLVETIPSATKMMRGPNRLSERQLSSSASSVTSFTDDTSSLGDDNTVEGDAAVLGNSGNDAAPSTSRQNVDRRADFDRDLESGTDSRNDFNNNQISNRRWSLGAAGARMQSPEIHVQEWLNSVKKGNQVADTTGGGLLSADSDDPTVVAIQRRVAAAQARSSEGQVAFAPTPSRGGNPPLPSSSDLSGQSSQSPPPTVQPSALPTFSGTGNNGRRLTDPPSSLTPKRPLNAKAKSPAESSATEIGSFSAPPPSILAARQQPSGARSSMPSSSRLVSPPEELPPSKKPSSQ